MPANRPYTSPVMPNVKPGPLQRFNQGLEGIFSRLAGPQNPYLSPEEQQVDSQRRRLAMMRELINASAPHVKGTQGALLSAFVRYPLLTLKVIAGIHWEALRLWGKGLRLVDRPRPGTGRMRCPGSPVDRRACRQRAA